MYMYKSEGLFSKLFLGHITDCEIYKTVCLMMKAQVSVLLAHTEEIYNINTLLLKLSTGIV